MIWLPLAICNRLHKNNTLMTFFPHCLNRISYKITHGWSAGPAAYSRALAGRSGTQAPTAADAGRHSADCTARLLVYRLLVRWPNNGKWRQTTHSIQRASEHVTYTSLLTRNYLKATCNWYSSSKITDCKTCTLHCSLDTMRIATLVLYATVCATSQNVYCSDSGARLLDGHL